MHWRTTAEEAEFLDPPTAPLGRVPLLTRHATLLSGGSYFIGFASANPRRDGIRVLYPKELFGRWPRSQQQYSDGIRALMKRAYAEGASGRDALDDLATGVRRPSEVEPLELPKSLQHIDLEPLLDAVWNYVDARRIVTGLVQESLQLLDHPLPPGGSLGTKAAKALLDPRRLPPSRR
jgi:hypothetical protein